MKIIQFRRLREKKGNVLAYFDIVFSGLRINDFSLRISNTDGELYVDVPKRQWGGNYFPVVEFESKDVELSLLNIVHLYINDENVPVEGVVTTSKEKAQVHIEKSLKVPLTAEEKISISKRYLIEGFGGSREDIKRMRAQHSDEMRRRTL